jgi:hypothetical protein
MSGLTFFGLLAAILMVVSYTLERCNAWFVLAFALGCALASTYGFLQGAWPLGLVEAVWSLIALNRFYYLKCNHI